VNARTAPDASRRTTLVGIASGLSAYVLWGILPLYFLALAPTGPWEVVAWRVLLSLVFCLLLLTVTRSWRRFVGILRRPRLLFGTALAGLLIYVNWQTYLIATFTGHVIEASLGYFINPLVTVLLGVLVLRERLRAAQWSALAVAAVAVVVISVGYGTVPWLALILAGSFGVYGLLKNRLGPSVDPVSGLTLESAWLTPLAGIQLSIVAASSGITLFTAGAGHAALLLAAGVVTAVPLLLFAAGARRVPLSVIGLLQFLAPILQFVIGAWILGEPMPLERWIGFGLVWVALVVLTVDSFIAVARGRHPVPDVTELS
jgi:chloramphenicol-sensitive protein RarD